jgi:hypothetical protein
VTVEFTVELLIHAFPIEQSKSVAHVVFTGLNLHIDETHVAYKQSADEVQGDPG